MAVFSFPSKLRSLKMRYREFHPRVPLRRFVECIWTLQSDSSPAPTSPERILPDGCAELILNFGVPFLQHHDDGTTRLQPEQFLVGQITKPLLISPSGPVELIGIRFQPGGTTPFFRIPMGEITNEVVDLKLLSSEFASELTRELEPSTTLPEKVKLLEALLARQLTNRSLDSATLSLAAEIVERGGLVSLDRLATAAGISSRQLERRFVREVGIGPKLLCRILRFQQVFRALECDDLNWAPIAVECGYYDQAHLIRDFRQFAAQTPTALFSSQNSLTELFTRKTRTSVFSNTPRS